MAWPSNLVRTKNWGTEVLTDTDLEGQFDLIINWVMAAMDSSTGHKHDATANEGPKLDLTAAVSGILPVANGGTGAATLTDGGILLGSGTGAVTPMAVLADGEIVVGDGTTDPVALAAFTSSTGTLKHESGGVEADISAIAKGGLVTGTGAGTMAVKAAGTDNHYIYYDSGEASGLNSGALVTKSILNGGATLTGAATLSLDGNSGLAGIDDGTPVAFAGTLKNFYVRGDDGGLSLSFTINKNGVATSLVVGTVTSTTASDTSNTVSVSAGDVISISVAVNSGSGTNHCGWSLELTPS